MKILHILLAVILLFVTVGSLVACGESPLVGSWTHSSEELAGIRIHSGYTFNKDGTGSLTVAGIEMGMTYEEDDDTITLQYKIGSVSVEKSYRYRIEDDTLILQDGDVETRLKRIN